LRSTGRTAPEHRNRRVSTLTPAPGNASRAGFPGRREPSQRNISHREPARSREAPCPRNYCGDSAFHGDSASRGEKTRYRRNIVKLSGRLAMLRPSVYQGWSADTASRLLRHPPIPAARPDFVAPDAKARPCPACPPTGGMPDKDTRHDREDFSPDEDFSANTLKSLREK
jgi:hypothetical protein